MSRSLECISKSYSLQGISRTYESFNQVLADFPEMVNEPDFMERYYRIQAEFRHASRKYGNGPGRNVAEMRESGGHHTIARMRSLFNPLEPVYIEL